ncbi:hypothetical protein LEP3755_50580 [Leptolyngbya sp. NIES-3755]|nr:hypothetical protein LEP3755_50580 [Leptolyngbya sp. NIES-3755]
MTSDATNITGHFLDSSVVRPMMLGTQAYQQYFEDQFSQHPCYISPFIVMEMQRSYLRNAIEFYFTLRLPTIPTLSDALTFWSNRYQGSKHKAVQQLIAELLKTDLSDLNLDKQVALSTIASLIKSFIESLQAKFIHVGEDSTLCARVISFSSLDDIEQAIAEFAIVFDDVKTCRSQCRIEQSLLTDYRPEITAYLQQAETLTILPTTRGFLKIVQNLQEILAQGESACSCKRCERIGDAVIALDAPRKMQLEHTDHSFDYLCPPIQQPHRKHPSETAVNCP